MRAREFSLYELEQLSKLTAIRKVTFKQIQYTTEFKEQSITLSKAGQSAEQIFKAAGFDILIFPSKYCQKMLKQWKRQIRISGNEALKSKPKGRPKQEVRTDGSLTYEELEFKIAYLEEENRLLKKLKALGYI